MLCSSVVFWSFPSAAAVTVKNQHAARAAEKLALTEKAQAAQTELDSVSVDKEPSVGLPSLF